MNVDARGRRRLRRRPRRQCRRRLARARPARRRHHDARHVRDRRRARCARRTDQHRQLARSVVRPPAGAARATSRPSLTIYADVVLNPSFPPGHGRARQAAAPGADRSGEGAARRRRAAGRAAAVVRRRTRVWQPAERNRLRAHGRRASRATISARWHRDWFHPNNATVIVTGDTTLAARGARARAGVRQVGAGHGARASGCSRCRAPQAARVYLIDKPGAPQSVIVAAHVSEPGGQAGGPGDRDGDAEFRRHGDVAAQSQPAARQALELRDARACWSMRAGSGRSSSSRPCRRTRPRRRSSRCRRSCATSPARGRLAASEFASIMRTQTLGLPGRFATLASLEGGGDSAAELRLSRTTISPPTPAGARAQGSGP